MPRRRYRARREPQRGPTLSKQEAEELLAAARKLLDAKLLTVAEHWRIENWIVAAAGMEQRPTG